MGRSTQIMRGCCQGRIEFTFSTRLAVQPSSLCKINWGKSKMAASYFCILPPDWSEWFYSSIQLQLYYLITPAAVNRSLVYTVNELTYFQDNSLGIVELENFVKC